MKRKERSLAHIVTRFPNITETFILSDIQAMTTQWPKAHIIAFFKESGNIPPWVRDVHYYPIWRLYLASQLKVILSCPGRYFHLLSTIIQGHWSNKTELIKTLITWPKMVQFALEVETFGLEGVHAHWSNMPATTAYVAAHLRNIPLTVTAHAHDIYKYNTFLPVLLKKVDLLMTCTTYNKEYLLVKYPFLDPERIHVVYHGVDIHNFNAIPPKKAPPLELLSIGRMTWTKGFSTLIEAMARLRDWGLEISLKLLALPGPAESEVRQLIEQHRLDNLVIWLEKRPITEMSQLYQASHVFVLPCRIDRMGNRDGLPNVILEAMACGRPCVSTPVSGVPEAVIHEKTGLLVEPDQPEALALAIRRLYEDSEFRENLGKSARQYVEKVFDRQISHQLIVEKMSRIYG